MSNRALLVVGHGTREREGTAQFEQLVSALRAALPERAVEGCFLELQTPTIAEGIDRLVERGATEIHLAPALLFAAGHALRDIPAEIAVARRRHPGLGLFQGNVLGCHPELLALSARRYDEALAGASFRDARETLLILVGRGSREPSATAEMHRFARLRCELRPVGQCEVAFLAMAEPRVEAALAIAARADFRRVVVQPHLLFAGELSRGLATQVEPARRDRPHIDWRLAPVLGPEAWRAVRLPTDAVSYQQRRTAEG